MKKTLFFLTILLSNYSIAQSLKTYEIGAFTVFDTYNLSNEQLEGIIRNNSNYLVNFDNFLSNRESKLYSNLSLKPKSRMNLEVLELKEVNPLGSDDFTPFFNKIKALKTWQIILSYQNKDNILIQLPLRVSTGLVSRDIGAIYNKSPFSENYLINSQFITGDLRVFGNFTTYNPEEEDKQNNYKEYFQDKNGRTKKVISKGIYNGVNYKTITEIGNYSKYYENDVLLTTTSYENNIKIVFDNVNNTLISKNELKNGIDNGEYIGYENGEPIVKGEYIDGLKHKLWQEIYDVSDIDFIDMSVLKEVGVNLFEKEDMRNGKESCLRISEYNQGWLTENQTIKFQRFTGEVLGYYELIDGKPKGDFKFYYKNGNVAIKGLILEFGELKKMKAYDINGKRIKL